ncbi:MAG: NADH-quinone oxidoreductase subunit N [Verrucomicrobia bacterium]|nr:NADH-quinone oxidoreductase subunit N [Verrucomicrobiota bacterium]
MNFSLLKLEMATCGLAMLVLMLEAFVTRRDRRFLGYVGAAGLLAILAWSYCPSVTAGGFTMGSGFGGMWVNDLTALYFKRLFLIGTALVLVMSVGFARQLEGGVGEFFALILFACTGMMLTASVNDFLMLFVALETVTMSFYILVVWLRRQQQSLEAGVKYLILGALSSAFLVYGITFIYGTTGTTGFAGVAAFLKANAASAPLKVGLLLVLAGLGFKIATVPFQAWVPDVYQGAPTPVTAFLAVGSKAAGFALLLRVLFKALAPVKPTWVLLIGTLAGLSVLYGNLAAMPQRNVKRLLGYSSISHAGFLLLGIAAADRFGIEAVLFYLVAYLFTNLCAFTVISCLAGTLPDDERENYAGLAQRSPLLAAAMTVALASLAGVPPMAGFFAKFLIFTAMVGQKMWCLVIIGAIGVVVSLYYYLGVVKAMYWQEPRESSAITVSWPMRVLLWVTMVAVIGIGVFQGALAQRALDAAATLLK